MKERIAALTPRKTTEENGTARVVCEHVGSLRSVVTAHNSTVETVAMADKRTAVNQIDQMFRAFCDRTRLRILNLLQEGELCVGDIVESLQVPQSKVSRHLAHLRNAGLVAVRKEGLWCHYSLAPPKTEFHRKLLECAVTCFEEVPEIRSDNIRSKKLRRAGGCCPEKLRRADRKSRP